MIMTVPAGRRVYKEKILTVDRANEIAAELMEKYYGRGYEVEDFPAAPGCKDFNEWLVKSQGMEGRQERALKTVFR